MPESFGGRLREQRERQAVALATIAQQTKIKESFLLELEHDDLSHWPPGIFRRAYLRSYAAAIGLNPDLVLQEFLALYPDRPGAFPTEPPASADGPAQAPPTRLRYLLGSAFGSLTHRRQVPAPQLTPATPPVAASLPAEGVPVSMRQSPAMPESAKGPPESVPASTGRDLTRLAELCTAFGRIESVTDLERLLQDTGALLDARGLILWLWDEVSEELRPALATGYSEKTLSRLPAVRRDAENPTAEAFRSARPLRMDGALVVPIVTSAGCAGVLAMELSDQREPPSTVQDAASIVAAMLALVVGLPATAQPSLRPETASPRSSSELRSTAAV